MSQQSLSDLLKTIKKDYGKEYQQAADGIAPGGNWDVDLPVTLEYRALVTKSEFKKSNQGKDQIVITYEVQEPEEYAGAMLQQYVDPNPTQTWQVEQLAKLFGALGADMDLSHDFGAFVKVFEDHTVVLTTNKWGEQKDRNGVRYVNADKGQPLKTNVAPPKSRGGSTANLRPEITIPKDPEPVKAEESPAPAPATTPPILPGGTQSTGVNLPPGLRG